MLAEKDEIIAQQARTIENLNITNAKRMETISEMLKELQSSTDKLRKMTKVILAVSSGR